MRTYALGLPGLKLRMLAPTSALLLAASGCRRAGESRSTVAAVAAAVRPARHVIVMVPGYANGKFMVSGAAEHLGAKLDAEAHSLRYSDMGLFKPLPEYARELDTFVKGLKLDSRDRLELVAFSMGGLVARWYLEQMGGRATKLVTLCAPHAGTTKGSGYVSTSSSVRDMQPGSAFLKKLNGGKLAAGVEYHSVRISGDRTIRPRSSAILPGAKNYVLPGRMHSVAIFRDEIRDQLVAILAGKAKPNGPQDRGEKLKKEPAKGSQP